jgi:hypothetical protein
VENEELDKLKEELDKLKREYDIFVTVNHAAENGRMEEMDLLVKNSNQPQSVKEKTKKKYAAWVDVNEKEEHRLLAIIDQKQQALSGKHILIHPHTHSHTLSQTHTYTYTHMCIHTHINAHKHAYIHSNKWKFLPLVYKRHLSNKSFINDIVTNTVDKPEDTFAATR